MKSYRPLEVNGELDGLLGQRLGTVVSQHWREPFSKGALVLGVDGGLVVLQAYPESGRAHSGTNPGGGVEAVAAVPG